MPAFLLSPLFLKIGMAIAIAVVLGIVAYKVEHWCNLACKGAQADLKTAQTENKALRASIEATQKLADDMRDRWSKQVDYTEKMAHDAATARASTFAGLADRAKSIGAHSGTSFGLDAGRLFDSARSAAGGKVAGPAAKPEAAAPPVASSAEEFVVQMYEWAAICRARVDAWQEFYAGLQASVPK